MSFTEWLDRNRDQVRELAIQHADLCLTAVVVAGLAGVALGVLAHRSRLATAAAQAGTSVVFTVPSLALVGLLIPVTGLTRDTVLVMLVLYALVPIVRNTIAGLRSVDGAVLEAARGMGMGPVRLLLRVQLPLAWPVILAGLRVGTQLVLGLGAIAVYVTRIGLGVLIDAGLARFGMPNSVNQALAGTLGVAVLAVAFDLAWQVVGRLTTPRGIRA
ncbi:MAG: ABC transporter permease [Acidimicrobiia bacterium]